MAKNKEPGDNRRVGAVKTRSQVKNPVTGNWTKRDDKGGKFMDQKADDSRSRACARRLVSKSCASAAFADSHPSMI